MKKLIFLTLCAVVVTVSAKEWWETASFYQIYPQTFLDTEAGKLGTGDFAGIEKKLDYLKNLGVDALWLTPIFDSSYAAFGYDISNYEAVDTRYGSQADFKNLVDAVHAKGMKIIVDFVPNHCGYYNAFFQKFLGEVEEYSNWFVSTDKIGNAALKKPSNWQSISDGPGTAWNEIDGTGVFYYAQFNKNMPDLNFREPAVLEYFEKVMTTWLDFGLDGFRIDAISHGFEVKPNEEDGIYPDEELNKDYKEGESNIFDMLIHSHTQDQPELFDLIYDWRAFLDKYQADKKTETKIMMTESYSKFDAIKKFYVSDDGTKNGSHLPFNFQMISTITKDSKAADFVSMVDGWFKVVPEGKVTNWVIGNHDNSRAATRFGVDRIDLLNTIVLMLPGTSVTYYGEEIGMTDSCARYDDNHNNSATKCTDMSVNPSDSFFRSPMQWDNTTNAGFSSHASPWMPAADNYKEVNVMAQEGKVDSHLEIYRALMKLRKNKAITDSDKFEIKALGTNTFAFKRELTDAKEQSIFVLINFGADTEKIEIKKHFAGFPDLMTVEIAGGKSAYKKGDQISTTSEFELKQYESIVSFYNSASLLAASKLALLLLAVVSAFTSFKF